MADGRKAELVLHLLFGRLRASEIVGDLLEEHRPGTPFRYAVAKIVLSRIWRWPLTFVLAAVSMLLIIHRYEAFEEALAGQRITTLPGIQWLIAALCAWSVFVLNALHFGFRDRVSRLSLFAALLLCGDAILSGTQYHAIAVLASAALATYALMEKSVRTSAWCLLITAGCYAAVFVALMHLVGRPDGTPTWMLTAEFLSFWLVSFIAEGCMLTQSRRWLLT